MTPEGSGRADADVTTDEIEVVRGGVVEDAPAPAAEAAAGHVRWRPSAAGRIARLSVLGALLVVVLGIPNVVPRVYLPVVALAAVYALLALSMNVIVGYTGQVSLGHAAFVGLGAFAAGYALTEMGLPWIAALAVGAATGAVGAVVLGGIALRVAGLYLALVTIAYGLFAENTLFQVQQLTGGAAGIEAPRPTLFTGDQAYVYLCYLFLAIGLAFDWRLTATKGGRAIQALRDDERVAASWGINVAGYKLLAFTISGVLAAVAGGLFGSIREVASPGSFTFTFSLIILLMTVVGGAGNRWGVIQGGVIFAVLGTLLDRAHANWDFPPFTWIAATWEPAIGAALLILTLTLFPGGIAQQQKHLLDWLQFRRFHEPGGDVVAGARGGGGGAH